MSTKSIKKAKGKVGQDALAWPKITLVVILYAFGACLTFSNLTTPLGFCILVTFMYLILLPEKLLNPINIIYIQYLVFYGLAPLFATRYSRIQWASDVVAQAYFMLFTTYTISVLLLFYYQNIRKNECTVDPIAVVERLRERDYKLIAIVCLAVSLVFLILMIRQSGFSFALATGKEFMVRENLGGLYLGFVLPLYGFSGAIGGLIYKRKSRALFFVHLLLVFVLYVFISSKLRVIQYILLSVAPYLLNLKVRSKWTIVVLLGIAAIVVFGLYLRNISWMTFEDILPYTFNYFDTLEQFLILVNDFDPSFMGTFFLPFNWILLKFGMYVFMPYHDMSCWFTALYYPDISSIGATVQLPIEADLYLSFGYFGGLILLAAYLKVINWLYEKSRESSYDTIIIYMIEFTFIASHYKGGLLMWWYVYLIPFYFLLHYAFKLRSTKSSDELVTTKASRQCEKYG